MREGGELVVRIFSNVVVSVGVVDIENEVVEVGVTLETPLPVLERGV